MRSHAVNNGLNTVWVFDVATETKSARSDFLQLRRGLLAALFLAPTQNQIRTRFGQALVHLLPEPNGTTRDNRRAACNIKDLRSFHGTITPVDCKERSSTSPISSHSDSICLVCCPSAGAFDKTRRGSAEDFIGVPTTLT
jgi:hypothetical protein